MKKLVYKKFGGVDVLELMDAPIPALKSNTVLVKVKAAAINPVDWKMREGQLKILSGWKFPQGSGLEFSGVVEEISVGVNEFKIGDEVFGAAKSCMAEYIVADIKKIAHKPTQLTHEQASIIPIVGITAASIFTKLLTIEKGMEVLINGATGGIGMFATQMAKNSGAIVSAVVSSKGIDLVKEWGAHKVINYKETNILTSSKKYDVVIELSDKLSFNQGKSLLKDKGYFIASLPKPKEILSGLINNIFSYKKYKLVGSFANNENLKALSDEVVNSNMDLVIAKSFPLEDFREAYTEAAQGTLLGKLVLSLT
ncbi:MAG: NADP-dependent oxidoreductase [Cytophagales bacterium]|nr:MAG: NADP-dependent oxidoreductase [Cytophagales bacterium]